MAALSINSRNVKAHYRMASALFALNKLPEAASACSAGLMIDPSNTPLLALDGKVKAKQALQDEKEKKKREEQEMKKKEAETLKLALQARQIKIRYTGKAPEIEGAALKLVPDPTSLKSTLVVPVIVLYPLHMQSDIIKAFGEEQTLKGHLSYLLPLPFDKAGEYTIKEVEAFMETPTGGLIKVGKNVELLKVLSGGKVELVDGFINIMIVLKSRTSEWIESFKKNNTRAKKAS
jgi:hypothetical protein